MKQIALGLNVFVLLAFVLASCSLPVQTADETKIPTSVATMTTIPAASAVPVLPQAEHRIGIRLVNGAGEFYDKQTGATFKPRGVNYAFVPIGDGYTNLLLRVNIYSPQRTRDDFSRLASLGYNTVRVFLDHCNRGPGCIANIGSPGLNPAYLDNIADMTIAARQAGIYLLFTSNDLPDDGGYSNEANFGSGGDFAGYRNSYYLRPQAVSATRRYWRDILTGLAERNAAFDFVLGWQLLNEQWMFLDQPPLSLASGTVETTTGSYDMSDPAQKKQMVSDGLVYYIAQVKEEILIHDPTALVTMGFFAPEVAAPGWYVETASLLRRSDLDFFDFHAYPGSLELRDYVEAFGMEGYNARPIILGEYGPFRHIYTRADSAARVSTNWVADSCELGFSGWLYWAYYPAPATANDRTWGLVDENDYLLELFAPANQPNPCVAVEIPNDNLAFGKPARASSSLAQEPPANALDDNSATHWGAGAFPVQWIEVDLQGAHRITEIRLQVAQYPAGNTIHRVQVRTASTDAFVTVHEFTGFTQDNDWLVFTPDIPLEKVVFIRIQTTSSPSWVAWKQIQVFGESQ